MHQLHTETPLAKAIFELFGNFEAALRHVAGDLPAGSIKAFIFGGCALHIHTNARGSNDLDVELEAARHLKIEEIRLELDPVYFEDENGLPSILELDTQFNTALASVSSDYKERAIPLTGREKPLLFIWCQQWIWRFPSWDGLHQMICKTLSICIKLVDLICNCLKVLLKMR